MNNNSTGIGAGPLMGSVGLPSSLPHQLSQLCQSQQQHPLLALQNFNHLLPPPNYAADTQQQQQQQHHHQHQHQHNHFNNNSGSSGIMNNNNSNIITHHNHHHHQNQQQQQQQQQQQLLHHLNNHRHHHHHHHNHHQRYHHNSSSSSSSNNNYHLHDHEHNSSHILKSHHEWRKSKSQFSDRNNFNNQSRRVSIVASNGAPHSLLDLSAKIVAEHIPFQSIEQRYEHIPEPVQRRIIFWSFPRQEDDIKMYSSLSSDTFNSNGPQNNNHNSNNNLNSNNNSNNLNSNSTTQPPSSNNPLAWIDPSNVQAANLSNNTIANSNTVSTSSLSKNQQLKQLTFHKGLRLYNEGCVQDVLQVGFNLSGLISIKSNLNNQVSSTNSKMRGNNHSNNSNNNNIINNNLILNVQNNNNNNINNNNNNNNEVLNNLNQAPSTSNDALNSAGGDSLSIKNYRVSVTFDRCKITSVSCSCELQDIFWCEHVVALILYRIRNPETIDLRVPISETLLSLDRQQLQKLVQYIIAEHHTEVLPTAQRLLDEMRQSFSEINQIQGAPDPTAGACADDEHIWHLDEFQVNEKVQNYLNLVCSNSKDAVKQINALFEKIREMFRAKDSNGTRLLKLITEQFLQYATRNEKSRPLWDQLVSLWVVVMLNPDLSLLSKQNFVHLLTNWSKVPKCPKEDVERRVTTKRKAAELSDDEDSDDYSSNSYYNDYPMTFYQSNKYELLPAHLATHSHRVFQPNTGLPVLGPYNQPPILPSSCPYHSIAKKRGHRTQHSNETYSAMNRISKASGSSSHHGMSRNLSYSSGSNENRNAVPQEPRSVFYRALDFQGASWEDPHLQLILNKDGPVDYETSHKSNTYDFTGNPLWNEPISQAAARIETLRSHGYREQALRLTVATVRRLKLQQDQWCLASTSDSPNSELPCMSKSLENYSEGWIGHPFDPINVLMDLLLETSLTEVNGVSSSGIGNSGLSTINPSRCSCPYNQAIHRSLVVRTDLADLTHRILPDLASLSYSHGVERFPILPPLVNLAPRRAPNTQNQSTSDKTTYYHVPVPGSCPKDTYLKLAVEVALIALGQQRSIPTIATAHDRAVRQEAELISKLESIDTSDPLLIEILEKQTTLLLQGAPFQNSCCGVPTDSAPLHTFSRYLFDSLVCHCPKLAYEVGVYALKMPLLPDENGENFGAARTSPRSINHNHLQSEQLALAQTMLSKAKDDGQQGNYLRKVYRASVKNIKNPASLLKLSKHALKEAKPNGATLYNALLRTSFELGLQVLKITLSPHTANGKTRREAILFIVECATDIGLEAVLQVMKDSRDYFSPTEALNLVVARESDHVNLRSQAVTKLKLNENLIKEAELNRRSRDLVLECANRDPTNCALEALKFCEIDDDSLKKALRIVIDAGTNGTMDSTQLIKVANHIDAKGMVEEAFDIAIVAVNSLSIPSNSESSSSKSNIFSACEYAQKVKGGFSTLIPKLLENIGCATVLSEIYHKFSPKTLSYRNYGNDTLSAYSYSLNPDARCWDALLQRTLTVFKDTTHTRLQNISPRHYGEFIEFLLKAQSTFEKAPGGPKQFEALISEITKSYKTKKKLMERLKDRFDHSVKTCL